MSRRTTPSLASAAVGSPRSGHEYHSHVPGRAQNAARGRPGPGFTRLYTAREFFILEEAKERGLRG